MLARLDVQHLGKECHMRKINLAFKESKKKSGAALAGVVIIVSLCASLSFVFVFVFFTILTAAATTICQ